MNSYYLDYLKQDGTKLGQINTFTRLEYGTRENEIGVMTLTLPAELFPGIPESSIFWRYTGRLGQALHILS